MGPFELLSDGTDLPVLAFKLTDPDASGYTVFDVSERLRQRGWLVPAYTFPAEPAGHRRAADRRPERLQPGPGRAAGRGSADAGAVLEAAPQRPVPLLPDGHRAAFAH